GIDARDFGSPRDAAVVAAVEEAGRIRRLLVDAVGILRVILHHPLVAELALSPCRACGILNASVVLGTAYGAIGVGRVEGQRIELGDLEVGVEVRPGDGVRGGVIEPPDASAVAVEQMAACIEGKGMMVGRRAGAVGAGGDVGPSLAAVRALDER